jgi:hypothetical protein
MKSGGIAGPVFTAQLDYGYSHFAQQAPEMRMNSVDELRPELDRNGRERVVDGENPAAHTIARLKNDWLETFLLEFLSGGEARDPRSDDNDLYVRRIFHRPGF